MFVAYLSQCFADNGYVTVQLSVLLIYKFLSVQVYFLSRNIIILYTIDSQLLWHCFYLVVDRIDIMRE